MGFVNKADDTRHQRTVIIKALKPETIGDTQEKEHFIFLYLSGGTKYPKQNL